MYRNKAAESQFCMYKSDVNDKYSNMLFSVQTTLSYWWWLNFTRKNLIFWSISFKTCMISHYTRNQKFIDISMMLQLDIWLKYVSEYTNFSRPIPPSLIFPLCLDVMPLTIPVPGTWLGCCINKANVRACTCIQVSKPKSRARALSLWEYSASTQDQISWNPVLCLMDVNSTAKVQCSTTSWLTLFFFFHTAVDQVTVAAILFLTGPVTLEVVACPTPPCFVVHASDCAGGPEWLGQRVSLLIHHTTPVHLLFKNMLHKSTLHPSL